MVLMRTIIASLVAIYCAGCVESAGCVAHTVEPEWCVRICEGRSLEWTKLGPEFGQRCGDCRCFNEEGDKR